jgi:catechol 2,3-dioxygenase-like lactoylglutathione lyase family enzyme
MMLRHCYQWWNKLRAMRPPVWLLVLACQPVLGIAGEIDFTRHLSHHVNNLAASNTNAESFVAVPGAARVIVTSVDGQINATIQLNGKQIVGPGAADGSGRWEVPVTLEENNSLTVSLAGALGGGVSVRVKQLADIELHVLSRVHFNTNVSDFTAAREFYGKLGFETLTGFPDTNTQEMALAIGIEPPTDYDGSQGETAGGYLLHGELVGVGGFSGGLIDLIEFTIPRDEAPPYAKLNHLGMARAAMHTTNIAEDYRTMKEQGVEFISAPASRSDGTKFAIFSDLDGTHYELIEVDGEDEETETTHIVGLAQVNVNVSDFERSRAWYQMFGYEVSQKLATTDSLEVARAMGFDEKFVIEGAIVTHEVDRSTLELVQWIKPFDPERAYPIPVNHLGIHRMAYATSDIEADVATLKAQGVEFLSPITPCCSGPDSSGSIIAFYDPDGTVVELVEQPYIMQLLTSLLTWIRNTFN